MAKVSSKRSPMPLSFLFANNRRVKSTKGHRLASWWYSTWINVIVTVPKSCYCKTLMKGPTDEIDGTRLKSWCKVCFCACLLNCFSCVRLFATLWTVAHQALLSMGFSRQEYWSGLPCLPPGELPDPGIKLRSPALQAHSLPSGHQGSRDNVYWPALIVCDVLPYCVWCVIPMANLQGGCYSPHFTVEETEVSRGFLHSRSSAGKQ